MKQPRIHVEYQVWDSLTNNVIATFDTADQALASLTRWIETGGGDNLSDLYLCLCKWSPDLSDDEGLALPDDEWVGPGPVVLEFLASLRHECRGPG
jgi:hypothetical protein